MRFARGQQPRDDARRQASRRVVGRRAPSPVPTTSSRRTPHRRRNEQFSSAPGLAFEPLALERGLDLRSAVAETVERGPVLAGRRAGRARNPRPGGCRRNGSSLRIFLECDVAKLAARFRTAPAAMAKGATPQGGLRRACQGAIGLRLRTRVERRDRCLRTTICSAGQRSRWRCVATAAHRRPGAVGRSPRRPRRRPSAAPAEADELIEFSADQVTYDSDADIVTARARCG